MIKLHLLLDHKRYLPVFAHVTEGKAHEVNITKGLSFPKGSRGLWGLIILFFLSGLERKFAL